MKKIEKKILKKKLKKKKKIFLLKKLF